jgi:hypothetical protein
MDLEQKARDVQIAAHEAEIRRLKGLAPPGAVAPASHDEVPDLADAYAESRADRPHVDPGPVAEGSDPTASAPTVAGPIPIPDHVRETTKRIKDTETIYWVHQVVCCKNRLCPNALRISGFQDYRKRLGPSYFGAIYICHGRQVMVQADQDP